MTKENTNSMQINFYRENLIDKMLYIKTSDGATLPMFVLKIEENASNEVEPSTYTVVTFDIQTNLMKNYTYIQKTWFDLAILACQKENIGTYVELSRLGLKKRFNVYEHLDEDVDRSYSIMAL